MESRELTKPQIQTDKPYVVCSVCGWLVPESDITMEFVGNYADFKQHTMGQWHLVVCEQCRLKLNEIENGGETAALMRMGQAGNDLL